MKSSGEQFNASTRTLGQRVQVSHEFLRDGLSEIQRRATLNPPTDKPIREGICVRGTTVLEELVSLRYVPIVYDGQTT